MRDYNFHVEKTLSLFSFIKVIIIIFYLSAASVIGRLFMHHQKFSKILKNILFLNKKKIREKSQSD
jgi:hypothetical protein